MSTERHQQLRLVEAILFAAAEPVETRTIAARLPEDANVEELLNELADLYANRGVNLCRREGRWTLRTAPDLAPHLQIETEVNRKLSRAAIETLAIIAYHQPITRAEIEEVRGVQVNRGTIDMLLECGWIKPGRRRRSPGRPVTWMTTPEFLDQFGLVSIEDLPGMDELKAAGLLDTRPAIEALGKARAGLLDDEQAPGADDIGDEEEADFVPDEDEDFADAREDDDSAA